MIDRLKNRGLVARSRDERDGRRIVVRLTDAGVAASHRVTDDRLGAQRALLGDWDDDLRSEVTSALDLLAPCVSA